MKSFTKIALLSCLLSLFVFGDLAVGQGRGAARTNSAALLSQADAKISKMSDIMEQYAIAETSKRFNVEALQATANISNQSGAKIVADFYATSDNQNIALSPPTMVATFAALTHLGKGKTKEELQTLLSLDGNEKTAFAMLGEYLSNSYGYYASEEEKELQNNDKWEEAQSLRNKKFGGEFQRLYKEFQELSGKLDKVLDAEGMPLSMSLPGVSSLSGISTGTYDSIGYLLVNNRLGNVDNATQREFLEKFGTKFESTNFSESGVKKFNDEIARIVGDEFGDVIEADDDAAINVCSAMNLFQDWGFIMEDDELFFNFDKGREEIWFYKGDFQVRDISVNNKPGWCFPLGLSDLMIVKCGNGADLKAFAKTIATEGLRIDTTAGSRLRAVGLRIPSVDFQTEFDLIKYAQTKGLSVPFTLGQAEYALSDSNIIHRPCTKAYAKSLFQVDRMGITLKQVTEVEIPLPVGRDQRIGETITIDSPYLMVITERNFGTVLGMAFIANPEVMEEEFDIPESPQRPEPQSGQQQFQSPGNNFGNPPRSATPGNVGIRIGRVVPNSTATRLTNSATGRSVTLEAGDFLASINGQEVRAIGDASRIISELPRNSNVSIEIIDRRSSRRMTLTGRLDVSSRQRLGINLVE